MTSSATGDTPAVARRCQPNAIARIPRAAATVAPIGLVIAHPFLDRQLREHDVVAAALGLDGAEAEPTGGVRGADSQYTGVSALDCSRQTSALRVRGDPL